MGKPNRSMILPVAGNRNYHYYAAYAGAGTCMTIRVMLADAHKIMQEGLKALLDDAPEIEVVGLASNGRDVL